MKTKILTQPMIAELQTRFESVRTQTAVDLDFVIIGFDDYLEQYQQSDAPDLIDDLGDEENLGFLFSLFLSGFFTGATFVEMNIEAACTADDLIGRLTR